MNVLANDPNPAMPPLIRTLLLALVLALLGPGCSSTEPGTSREKGRDGTVAYHVDIEASSAGARVEVDGDYIGQAPATWKVFGDKDGTFHNFGSYDIVVKAYPTQEGERVQTKVFHTGGWFQDEDMIPKRIYFDLREQRGGGEFSVDLPAKTDE